MSMNTQITILLNSFLHVSPFFDWVVYAFAQYSIFVVAAFFAWVTFSRLKIFILGITTSVIAWIISQGINIATAVERPFIKLSEIVPLFTHGLNDSFPSGHAIIMFTLAFYTYYKYSKNTGLILMVLSIISSLARVAAGIHWPTDIFGSIILAYIAVVLADKAYSKYYDK